MLKNSRTLWKSLGQAGFAAASPRRVRWIENAIPRPAAQMPSITFSPSTTNAQPRNLPVTQLPKCPVTHSSLPTTQLPSNAKAHNILSANLSCKIQSLSPKDIQCMWGSQLPKIVKRIWSGCCWVWQDRIGFHSIWTGFRNPESGLGFIDISTIGTIKYKTWVSV